MITKLDRMLWKFLPALAALAALSAARADVYVTIGSPVGVMKYNDDGSGGTLLFSTTAETSPRSLTIGPDGALYVCFAGTGNINRYDSNTGALIGTFVAKGTGKLVGPITPRFYNNFLYVTDFGTSPAVSGGPFNGQVLRFNLDGTFHDQIVTPIPSGGHFPGLVSAYGLAFDADGNIDVGVPDGSLATQVSGAVGWGCALGYSPTGVFLDITANSNSDPNLGSAPPNFAVRGIAFSPDNSQLFAALENATTGTTVGAVGVYDATTHDVVGYIGPDAHIKEPRAVEFGPVDGYLYVASTNTPASGAASPSTIDVYGGAQYAYIGTFASGITLPYDIAFRQLTSLTSADSLLSFGATTTAAVTLSAPAGVGGLTVALTNSAPTAATVPATVVVPQGATAAMFPIKATKNLKAGQAVSITASYTTITQTLTLNVIKAALTTLTVLPATVHSGATATGTVTLSAAAPTGGYMVNLSSSDPVATVPATVTVAAGSKTATFSITTEVFAGKAKAVTITAEFAGVTKTAKLDVTQTVLTTLTVLPATVAGGATATGTVTLSAKVPTSYTVNLSSSDPVATVPATVTVAAGSKSAIFTVTTTAFTGKTKTVTLTAEAAGVTKTATLLVKP